MALVGHHAFGNSIPNDSAQSYFTPLSLVLVCSSAGLEGAPSLENHPTPSKEPRSSFTPLTLSPAITQNTACSYKDRPLENPDYPQQTKKPRLHFSPLLLLSMYSPSTPSIKHLHADSGYCSLDKQSHPFLRPLCIVPVLHPKSSFSHTEAKKNIVHPEMSGDEEAVSQQLLPTSSVIIKSRAKTVVPVSLLASEASSPFGPVPSSPKSAPLDPKPTWPAS